MMKKLLTVLLTVAMLITLVPAVLAEGEAAPRVPVTAPTAERVFYAVNGLEGSVDGTLFTKGHYAPFVVKENITLTVDLLFNEDDTLTDSAKEGLSELLFGETAIFPADIVEGLEIPADVNGLFTLFTEITYRTELEFFEALAGLDQAYADAPAAFKAAYPDSAALYAKFLESFADPENITKEEILFFVMGDEMIIDENGTIVVNTYDILLDNETEEFILLSDIIAPSGAYLPGAADKGEEFGAYKNVFAQLKAAYDANEIDAYEAFEIVTGYAPASNGALYPTDPALADTYTFEGSDLDVIMSEIEASIVPEFGDDNTADETAVVYNIAEIMDADGNFLSEEYGVATVWELLDAYVAEMSTDAVLKGDVNGDGKINTMDVIDMLKSIANITVEGFSEAAADVDGDGKVNTVDAILMLKYIADWDVEFVY